MLRNKRGVIVNALKAIKAYEEVTDVVIWKVSKSKRYYIRLRGFDSYFNGDKNANCYIDAKKYKIYISYGRGICSSPYLASHKKFQEFAKTLGKYNSIGSDLIVDLLEYDQDTQKTEGNSTDV